MKILRLVLLAGVLNVHATAQVQPTNVWMDCFSQASTVNGQAVPIGALVQAYDPQGVLCGEYRVQTAGWYGYLHVYGDDATTTGIDEGAVNGDTITFRIEGLAALDLVSTFRQALGPAYAVINAGASYSRRLLPVSDVLGGKAPALVTVLSTEDVNLPVRELLVGPTGLPLLATVAGATVSWQWELDEFVDRIPRPPAMDNQWFVETYRFRMAGPLGPTDPDVVDFDYISTAMTVPTRYLALSSDEDSVVVAIRHGEARSTRWNDGLSIQLGSAVGVIHITATSVAARDAAWHRLQPYVAADSVGRPVLESFALSQDRIREQRLEEERGRAQEVEDMRLAERELQRRGQEEALRRAEDQRRIEAQERKTERDKKDDREPRM